MSFGRNTYVVDIGNLVFCDGRCQLVYLVRDLLWRRRAICKVVLDSEVLLGTYSLHISFLPSHLNDRSSGLLTSGVVTGSQQDSSGSPPLADDVAGGGCTEDSVLSDQKLLDAVCGSDFGDYLDDLGVVVTAVTTDDEECILGSLGDGLEERSNEVLGVVLLLEDDDLLAETRAGPQTLSVSNIVIPSIDGSHVH